MTYLICDCNDCNDTACRAILYLRESYLTFECSLTSPVAVRSDIVRRRAGDRRARDLVDTPAVPRRLVALLFAIQPVLNTLRDEGGTPGFGAVILLGHPSLLAAAQCFACHDMHDGIHGHVEQGMVLKTCDDTMTIHSTIHQMPSSSRK